MINAKVLEKYKRDSDIPFYHGCNSWQVVCEIPWDVKNNGVFTAAEILRWFAAKRSKAKAEALCLREAWASKKPMASSHEKQKQP